MPLRPKDSHGSNRWKGEGGDQTKSVTVGRVPIIRTVTCPGCGKQYPTECDWCSDVLPRPLLEELAQEPTNAQT